MLSQSNKAGKLSEKKRVLALPELVPPRHVRLKFCKVGKLQYISHLDLQTTFNRIINRACLPVWYTKGFNPHIKMVFGLPLPVGCESECEYLDIRIERDMPDDEILARLNAELTEADVLYLHTEPDVEKGIPVYEVEFAVDLTDHFEHLEYEYTIHADTGEILEFDKERD